MATVRGLGRAWGNALGGWRMQGRTSRGQFMRKGMGAARRAPGQFRTDMRNAGQAGAKAQYRSTYRSGGNPGMKQSALGVAEYAFAAMNSARKRGYFINPEIGLSGVGVSVGYGQKIAPKYRASVAIKVSINRTDGGPIVAATDNFVRNSLADYPHLQSLIQYGVIDTGMHDTAIVREGTTLRVKSGRKANTAIRKNPTYRARQDKKAAAQPVFRAERRNQKKSQNIGNGHKLVQDDNMGIKKAPKSKNIGNGHKVVTPNRYDVTKHKNDYGTYTKSRKRSNKKGVASTITA